MTTKHRFRSRYRLQLREKDHVPMHVHLVGGPVNVRISLETLTIVEGWCPRSLEAEVLTWVRGHRDELIEEWKKWHP
ncbi:MAG: DUF4160 domain-containing protein [Thermodesulfobacteriota bacterium]